MARGGLVNLVGAVFAGLSGFGVTWLVAQGLGPTHAGIFFAATAAFVVTTTLAKLGTQTGLVYWTARLRALGADHRLLDANTRIAVLPVLLASMTVAVAVWWLAPILAARGDQPSPGAVDEYTDQLRILAIVLPAAVVSDTLLAATRGYRAMRPTVVLDRILRTALQLVFLGLLTVVTVPPSAYALAWVLPYVPIAVLAYYAASRVRRRHTPVPRTLWSPAETIPTLAELSAPGRLRREFWRFTSPRAVASVAQMALQRVDILLVAALAGFHTAALYTVASRFMLLGQFANQAIAQSMQPRLAERLALGDRDGARALYQIATAWLVCTAWPIYLMVAVFAPLYLKLFGPAYADGGPVVLILAATMLIATGCGTVDIVLSMAGRTAWNLVNVVLALAASIAVHLALIPRMGATGAAIGLATAILVNNLLPLVQVWSALGLHPFGRATLSAAGLTTLLFGLLPWLATLAFGGGLMVLVGSVAGGGVIVGVVLRDQRALFGLVGLGAGIGRSDA